MHLAVTGAAGFIGSHLTRALVSAGHTVRPIDNLYSGSWDRLKGCVDQSQCLEVDVRDIKAMDDILVDVEVVVHLAALSNVMLAAADPDYLYSTNILGTYCVCKAAERAGVKRIVFTSSREAYGEASQLPVPEGAPLHPKNSYGHSKAAGEAIVSAFSATGSFEVFVARLVNVFGPYDQGRVIPIFIERAMQNVPLIIYGGDQIIDFIWIEDLVNALITGIGLAKLPEGPINIGSGVGTSIGDLARRVCALVESESRIETQPARAGEVERFVADVHRARRLLNLREEVDPLRHLPELVGHMRDSRL